MAKESTPLVSKQNGLWDQKVSLGAAAVYCIFSYLILTVMFYTIFNLFHQANDCMNPANLFDPKEMQRTFRMAQRRKLSGRNDEVLRLPGLTDTINFRHYSGYLNVSKNHRLHYWFVESQQDPLSSPVLLWLNGGPGCSSLVGFLNALGPFLVNDDGRTLRLNQFSWNRNLNIIFLESPAGTGYSYSINGNITTNDDLVAKENLNALQLFFDEFLEYRKNDFYIAGQSYGGVFVPTLAKLVVENASKLKLNLKGIMIGNGIVDASLNLNTVIHFAFWHGLISKNDFEKMSLECCGKSSPVECTTRHKENDSCSILVHELLWHKLIDQKINIYDIYAKCTLPNMTTRNLKNIEKTFKIRYGPYPCINDTAIKMYVNQPAFRKALYIPDEAPVWDTCSDPLNSDEVYGKLYEEIGMKGHINYLIKSGVRVLLYNGDTDLTCNFGMAQAFAQKLALPLKHPKRPWFLGKQNAGFVTEWQDVQVVTIKGAGHMAPETKREETRKVIQDFIERNDL